MTDTLIALISIFFGIIGGNMSYFLHKKSSLGFTGNSIAGVFGSIFIIKSFGRLGFDPMFIMQNGTNYLLLAINLMISLASGFLGVLLVKKLKNYLSMTTQ